MKVQNWLFQKDFDHIVWHQSITQHRLAGYYEDQRDVCGPWKQSREVGDQLASSITLTRTFPFHQHIDAFWRKSHPIWNQRAKFWKINVRFAILESKAMRSWIFLCVLCNVGPKSWLQRLWLQRLLPYPCSHFYFDIKFGDRLYSNEKRRAWPLLFWIKSVAKIDIKVKVTSIRFLLYLLVL